MISGREILICHNFGDKKHEIYSTKRNDNSEGNDNEVRSANLREYLLSYCARHVTIMSIILLESSFRNQFRHLQETRQFDSAEYDSVSQLRVELPRNYCNRCDIMITIAQNGIFAVSIYMYIFDVVYQIFRKVLKITQ